MANEGTARPFHERFDIDVGASDARKRFINRVANEVFDHVKDILVLHQHEALKRTVVSDLGLRYERIVNLEVYVGNDFLRCLHTLEALYQALEGNPLQRDVNSRIGRALRRSEVDLGVDWQPPNFVRTGARLLDESLVNEPLRWLSDPQYELVHQPFSQGLRDYVKSEGEQDRLSDVVTDMYESVEAMARAALGNNRELSRNQELFIKHIKASKAYKQLLRQLLKEYVDYGGTYRHAARQGNPKSPPSEPEAESFIYLTGLFIRLAIRQAQPST